MHEPLEGMAVASLLVIFLFLRTIARWLAVSLVLNKGQSTRCSAYPEGAPHGRAKFSSGLILVINQQDRKTHDNRSLAIVDRCLTLLGCDQYEMLLTWADENEGLENVLQGS